jgi:hypothetical protein
VRRSQHTANSSEPLRYRLELEGEVAEEWGSWFAADRVVRGAGRTVLEFSVTDQAALFGVLRRVHDLHLPLISLTRVEKTQ